MRVVQVNRLVLSSVIDRVFFPSEIVQTPLGWYALSHRSVGHSRTPQGYETALYHSANGVEWRTVTLTPNGDDLMLRGLAPARRRVQSGCDVGLSYVSLQWSSSTS